MLVNHEGLTLAKIAASDIPEAEKVERAMMLLGPVTEQEARVMLRIVETGRSGDVMLNDEAEPLPYTSREELIEAGVIEDLDEKQKRDRWEEILNPKPASAVLLGAGKAAQIRTVLADVADEGRSVPGSPSSSDDRT